MNAITSKIVPTVDDLEPRMSADRQCQRTRYKRTKGVALQFHCPVAGCVYGDDSGRHFTCIKYLKQHYKKVHATKGIVCDKCDRGFAIHSDFQAHKLVCGTTFHCSCGMPFTSKEALLTHASRKQHLLPEVPQQQSADARKRRRVPDAECVATTTRPGGVKALQPTVVVVAVPGGDLAINECVTNSTKKPCFILPKSAPLNAVPLPTVAAMALSELSDFRNVASRLSKPTQTEPPPSSCACRRPARKNCEDVRRPQTGNAATQTCSRWSRTGRKRRRRRLTCRTTQTESPGAFADYNQAKQFSLPPYVVPSQFQADCGREDYSLSGGAGDLWQMCNDKLCQTIGSSELDNFNLVSSGTQTSPRSFHRLPKTSICDRFLDSPFHDYLSSMDDYSLPLPVRSHQDSESTQQQFSIETQTDVDLVEELLFSGGGGGGGSGVDTSMQTQTSEDLESIPYDQLLSHMETQTSDLFFPDLGGFCDIHTQTADEFGQQVHHTHTQTVVHQQQTWERSSNNLMDMETQTFLSLLATDDTR